MNIDEILNELSNKLPKFPDGRIDYTGSNKAVVLTCFVEYEGKILLLRRSDKVGTYQGLWNSVAGYIDERVPIKEKVLEELREELNINESDIAEMFGGEVYEFYDSAINKTWVICPYLVKLNRKVEVKIDWEHTEYKWIKPEEIKNFNIVPNLGKSLSLAMS